MIIPPLEPRERSREFTNYNESERGQVVFQYLFHSISHRNLDKIVLGLDSSNSKGFQSMGILHYVGLKNEHKGIFEGYSIDDAIIELKNQSTDFSSLIDILQLVSQEKLTYSKTNIQTQIIKDAKEYTMQQLLSHVHSYIKSKGFHYTKEEVVNLFLSLKSKPFVILSGISGTGKTKMVQWFAESVGATEENGQLALIPVRPDWSDGSDLLGYVDIKGDFKPGPLTIIIKEAEAHQNLPYFVLLDEMNLARVEHYFSDILSVMESRKWQGDKLVTSTLLSKEVTKEEKDLTLPSNVYIIGTVNMDETTHPFSKKVLDRANTIEFNRVELANLDFLEDMDEVEAESVSDEVFRSKYLHLKDVYSEKKDLVVKTTKFLEDINKILQPLNAHVGYRVRDEICFYMAYNDEGNLLSEKQALDHCILQKILPRIAGSDSRVKELLDNLFMLLTRKKMSEDMSVNEEDARNSDYPNSALKVLEMMRRLDDGFTSFWIS